MSNLIDEIRHAQIRAGEDAVIKNLERMGFISPERQRELDIIALARQDVRIDDTLEIDDEPKVSEGDDNGAWVAAWIWVDFDGTKLDKEKDEIGGDPAHVAHLSPEELAEDRKVIAEMLKEHERSG